MAEVRDGVLDMRTLHPVAWTRADPDIPMWYRRAG